MYCPSCGSQNASGTRFCKRCGANLTGVSEALSGKLVQTGQNDELVKSLKDYFNGRRKLVMGASLIAGGLFIMTLLIVVARFHSVPSFFMVSWLYIWGVIELAGGLSQFIGASGELKALGYNISPSRLQGPQHPELPPSPQSTYSTGPVAPPASVTDETTRRLEQRGDDPPR
jgi:hypothetical protein